MATVSSTPKPAYIYDTTTDTWYPVGSVALANMRTFEFTATQGQTTFSGSDNNSATLDYIPGNVMVFLNGIAIVPGEDYTATNGTSIVLTEAASLNDVLTVNAFAGFHLSDTYTQSEINTRLADKADEAQLGQRNMIHNGAMQVHQRGTSTASITTAGYYTADRWLEEVGSFGTFTNSIENDAPSGSGLRKSLKMLCTTAQASPSSSATLNVQTRIEGQDLQRIRKGTASAQSLTVSFWVKSNKTGTYIFEMYDQDNNRQVSTPYTVDSSGVWEYKTLTIAPDLTGQFDNDNALSLYVVFHLGAGSNFTSGTLNTEWAPVNNANRMVGQTNLAAATNNYWQITGVQLEVGSEATPFEFEDFDRVFVKCQRYYQQTAQHGNTVSNGANTTSLGVGPYVNIPVLHWTGGIPYSIKFPVEMRTTPNLVRYGNSNGYWGYITSTNPPTNQTALTFSAAIEFGTATKKSLNILNNVTQNVLYGVTGSYTASADL